MNGYDFISKIFYDLGAKLINSDLARAPIGSDRTGLLSSLNPVRFLNRTRTFCFELFSQVRVQSGFGPKFVELV